tara:strand:- start:883 stop:1122 length:240 start_codon:yes stop_codon:yes gene_type:complete
MFVMLIGSVAYAEQTTNQWVPDTENQIVLWSVQSDNENAPKFSGYITDSDGRVLDVAIWSTVNENFLQGNVTLTDETIN